MNRRGARGARQPTGAKRHCNACVLLSTFSASTSNFAAIFWPPGRARVLAYGATAEEAMAKAEVLALRVIAERLGYY